MSKLENFIDHINSNILPFIDYDELDRSYHTEEKEYAKGVLNLLHIAMKEQYKSERLICDDEEDEYAVIPGVIQGKKNGEIAIALLGIDLLSSGEHCQTEILSKYGVVSQGESQLPKHITNEISARYMPYHYCYTAVIPGDIHILKHKQPDGIKEILRTFQNYTAELLHKDDINKGDIDIER
jgi:hypothetical protein